MVPRSASLYWPRDGRIDFKNGHSGLSKRIPLSLPPRKSPSWPPNQNVAALFDPQIRRRTFCAGEWMGTGRFFAPRGFEERHSFRFNNVFDIVANEVISVQTGVGLAEVNGFNRYEIGGADAREFLNRMACGAVTNKPGRVGLIYMLNHQGCLKGEATVANIPDGRIWYGSAAAAEYHDLDWLTAHIRDDEDVTGKSRTNDHTILVLAGPKSRDVLTAAARSDWSAEAFPWLSVRTAAIGIAPAVVMGVSFSGELAYEIHIPNAQLQSAYETLRGAGAAHGLTLFGARAVESMRLEKGYLHRKLDILIEFYPETSA